MSAWAIRIGLAVAALAAFTVGALSILDGWRPAGGNGVPWIEAVLGDSPQRRVDDFMTAVASGDRERALALWTVPDRGAPDAIDALRERRSAVADELIRQARGGYRIASIQWWGTCCEPHPVADPRHASAARVNVTFGDGEQYTFDVRTVPGDASLIDELARRWSITDAYRFGDEPILLRWVQIGSGSIALGSYRPPRTIECGRSDEMPNTYDAAGRECVWSAYNAGIPSHWSVMRPTVEGDPTRATITAQRGFIIVIRDLTADRFSAASDRRMWAWQCRTLTRRPWVTDADRYSFELTECAGDGLSTSFP